jgi:hypothetical protein
MGGVATGAPPPEAPAEADDVVSFAQLYRYLSGVGDYAILTLAVAGALGSGASDAA